MHLYINVAPLTNDTLVKVNILLMKKITLKYYKIFNKNVKDKSTFH